MFCYYILLENISLASFRDITFGRCLFVLHVFNREVRTLNKNRTKVGPSETKMLAVNPS